MISSIGAVRLLPLLEFGREREGVDLSKVVLTHHKLKNLGKRAMVLGDGAAPALEPVTEAGSGAVREQAKAYLAEIIQQLNDLFGGETTDDDQLNYVRNTIRGKLLESKTLQQQASNNTKEQFASSPDFDREQLDAIISAMEANAVLSSKALNSAEVRRGIKAMLLDHLGLWEALRERAAQGRSPV